MPDLAKPHFPERDRTIVAMREGGATLKAIALTFGLSCERIRQILARHHRRLTRRGRRPSGAPPGA